MKTLQSIRGNNEEESNTEIRVDEAEFNLILHKMGYIKTSKSGTEKVKKLAKAAWMNMKPKENVEIRQLLIILAAIENI